METSTLGGHGVCRQGVDISGGGGGGVCDSGGADVSGGSVWWLESGECVIVVVVGMVFVGSLCLVCRRVGSVCWWWGWCLWG
jgi:hypothetical protein